MNKIGYWERRFGHKEFTEEEQEAGKIDWWKLHFGNEKFAEEDYKEACLQINAEVDAGVSLSLGDMATTLKEAKRKRIMEVQ